MQIQLVSHASVLIRTEDVQIWTDPWLTGKVFNNSWTLLHEPAWDPAWLLAALAVFGLAYVVWTLDGTGAWCDPTGWLQGHAVWHLLGAVSAGLAFIYYWREKDR